MVKIGWYLQYHNYNLCLLVLSQTQNSDLKMLLNGLIQRERL